MNDTANRNAIISSVNYETGHVRVTYPDRDGAVSPELPFISNGIYKMPNVGDSVMVMLDGRGGTSGAVVGTIWNDKNIPANGQKDYSRIDLPGGCIECLNGDVSISGDGITVKADEIILSTHEGSITVSEIIRHLRSH